MSNTDLSKLSRKQLIEHFEKERQKWLAAGMSETDIFRVHFGEPNENGRGGDYRVWLDERKRIRPDHKYAPGVPASIDEIDPEGALISDGRNEINDVEFNIDIEIAFSRLTEQQYFCFVEVVLKGKTQQQVAAERGIAQTNVFKHISNAKKKLKKYFGGGI